MLTQQDIERVLGEYVDQFIPAMLRREYHLILVKGGPEYAHLSEQSHFAHIVNGVFGLVQLLKFLIDRGIAVPGLDETALRKALALYTIHDLHKDNQVTLQGKSSFSIPLERLREEYERLGLDEFVQVDEHLMRAANVHKRSSKHGDLLTSADPQAGRLWLWVRIADTLASVETPEEAVASLRGYLADLGPVFAPKSPPGKYALYYHQIKDVRGVLTQLVHQAVAQRLEQECGFFPLLYFATGTLYAGPAQVKVPDHERFIQGVIDGVLGALTQYASDDGAKGAALTGLRKGRYDFEDFVYSFADVSTLLEIARERAGGRGSKGKDVVSDLDKLPGKQGVPEGWDNVETVARHLEMDLDQPDAFLDHWDRARYYLLYVDHVVGRLNPESPLEWLLGAFPVPPEAADHLRGVADAWGRGGFGKYVVPVAYHFLKGPAFADRPAEALPPEQVMDELHRHTLEQLEQLDTRAGREGVVAQLGFRRDLTDYLSEHLYLSLAPEVHLSDDSLAAYSRPKKKGHSGKMCSLCNRQSAFVQDLRTGILDDFGRVFSNRVLPAQEAPAKNRPWCPICHLEFIFRKLRGLGLPGSASYGSSYRIYLYVLPTFSFTPEHLRLFQPLLDHFQNVTNLPVRDYGQDAPGAPRIWLERRALDPYWVEDLM
ncbi:MAG: type I-D CRISPR-associated protein Cas10d/Csc3, partial [Chloroflexi bacterium]